MQPAKVATLPEAPGSALQRNFSVRKIYTALEPLDDGRWEVVTIIETAPVVTSRDAQHERLIKDIEEDARAGLLVGRVIVKGL
jgi:hypothetical protein